jgi:hypothetical protein
LLMKIFKVKSSKNNWYQLHFSDGVRKYLWFSQDRQSALDKFRAWERSQRTENNLEFYRRNSQEGQLIYTGE